MKIQIDNTRQVYVLAAVIDGKRWYVGKESSRVMKPVVDNILDAAIWDDLNSIDCKGAITASKYYNSEAEFYTGDMLPENITFEAMGVSMTLSYEAEWL